MLVFGFLLIPIVLVSPKELPRSYYIPKVQGPALVGIEIIGESPDTLDLSGLGFGRIDSHVFDNLTHVKSIDLSNNRMGFSFPEWPYPAFPPLGELESLSLAANGINYLQYGQFMSLRNLKFLDISYNPISSFHGGRFYGLGKTTNISAKVSNGIRLLHTLAFDDFNDPIDRPQTVEPGKWLFHGPVEPVRICIRDGILEEVKPEEGAGPSEAHCKPVYFEYGYTPVERKIRNLTMDGMNVSGFAAGWYRLNSTSFKGIYLESNNIVNVTSEIFNDLPPHVINIELSRNKIVRLKNETIVNEHVKFLELSYNAISEIEDRALEKTNLLLVDLDHNKLNDTRFIATLPTSLQSLDLGANHISEISSNVFSRLRKLENVNFVDNNITAIQIHSLRGLVSAVRLVLARNEIKKMEVGSLQDLISLRYFDLSDNKITNLEKGVFDGLKVVEYIDLSHNNIQKITHDSFHGLTNTLRSLLLPFNEIETLENGTFIEAPTKTLALNDNRIRKLENGTFELETLEFLDLKNNILDQIHGEEFASLHNLKVLNLSTNRIPKIEKAFSRHLNNVTLLDLSNNTIRALEIGALQSMSLRSLYLQNNLLNQTNGTEFIGMKDLKLLDLSNNGIPKIEKGFAKHLGNLTELRLGYNPIDRLENGALFGLTKGKDSFVRLDGIRLEILQGGVFEDV